MEYKGNVRNAKPNKKRIAMLLLAGALVLGGGITMCNNANEKAKYEKIVEDAKKIHHEEESEVSQEVPEVPYVNEYGVEITKEQYEALQREKQKKKDDDWER